MTAYIEYRDTPAGVSALSSTVHAGVITRAEDASIFGLFRDGNLMVDDPPLTDLPPGARLIMSSGRFDDNDAPLNFLRRGHERFQERCAVIASMLRDAGRTCVLVPDHRDLLSDAPSVRLFLDRWADGPFEILLDAGRLLHSSMYEAADEHIERFFELIGPRAIAWRCVSAVELPSDAAASVRRFGEAFDPRGEAKITPADT